MLTSTAGATLRTGADDPVITEIVRNGLVAITEEMKAILMRTAYNMIIYEAQDFTVGVFDAQGETVSIGIGLPMFIRGMSDTVKAMIGHFGVEDLRPGDVLLTNDAYITGSHLNHMTFVVPVHEDGRLVAFTACMAHWVDIGGVLDGMTTDIYSEGLQMPIVKYEREGVVNKDILAIIRMNVRVPDRANGDLNAQVAAVKMGARRFSELLRRYGTEPVLAGIDAIMDHTEAVAREHVRSIPDGVYEAASYMDDDGVASGRRIPIRVKVTVAGDEMEIDLTDVGEQVKGFYNSGEAAGRACCQVAFKCLTSALERPINEGSFRPLKIVLPPGRIVSAVRPAAMRWWMTFPMTVVDTIFKALAPAIPDRVIAGHHADLMSAIINTRRPDGQLVIFSGGLIGGGWGAKRGSDGSHATICINDGDTHNAPIEQLEAKYPVVIERYQLRRDSGGAGTWQGGLGTEKVGRATGNLMFNCQVDRTHCRPWGLFGGLSGAGNQVSVQLDGEAETFFPSGKVLARALKPGERYVLRSGGGGGYGSPLERPIERVELDILQGYVSAGRAAKVYGIVFSDDGHIDVQATATRRAEMANRGEPTDAQDDTHEASSPLAGTMFRSGGLSRLPGRCC
ncbi:hydantoinase B/oxoprolinase family protein [Ramlibacter sp. AN1015]|uniref:hydantoinase B/oxoprolinase family protein n=1 Tax=Ramlibacter sp. AN1015 TaxID=3133428 RepID=UPI0030BDA0B1